MEFINLYKEIVADNAKSYKQWQLSELKDLAALLVAVEYGYKQENAVISRLHKVLRGPSSGAMTLKERHEELAEAFNDFARNDKLKNNIQKYVDENQDKVNEKKEEQK